MAQGREAAYRRSTYHMGEATARIGRRSRAMDAVLARLGAGRGVILGAWNPFSRPLPAAINARREARLALALQGMRVAEGIGAGPGGRWWERHVLVPGAPAHGRRLARRFGQAAVVVVGKGKVARLWWL